MFTREQARLICEAHEIGETLDNEEEMECLEENNPDLMAAYQAFHAFAFGDNEAG